MRLDPSSLAKVDEIFDQALDLQPSERADFLDRECLEPKIKEQVERLLAVQGKTSVFDDPQPMLGEIWQEEEKLPGTIGPYRPTRILGRGGMAVVYLAERTGGHFEQSVALKLIPTGSDRHRVVQRFQRERQILASLEHPSIARLIDGGVSEEGRPYFAMEHVDGLPIDQHCDEYKLSIDQRLELFKEVALAVHYAHRRLVLHRDLKPSNILVTAEGQVKLLDFGIAKVLAEDDPLSSQTTSRWLTPEFASPEQIRGETMSTASDIYQLGLLLYQLLTGRRPYEVTHSFAEAERLICDVTPTRPSQWFRRSQTRTETSEWSLEDAVVARSTQLPRIYRRLRGELDTIVMKCLRKEPARRYASAERLAADIEYHLAGLPVSAYPDSLLYRTRKTLRRHSKSAVAVAIVSGLFVHNHVVVTQKNLAIAEERDRANDEASKATAIRDYLVELFETANPENTRGEALGVLDMLERGVPRLASSFHDQPLILAEMQATTGEVYLALGLYEKAEELLDASVERVQGLDTVASLDYRAKLAYLKTRQGFDQESETLFRAVLSEYEALENPNQQKLADLRVRFASLLTLLFKTDEARIQLDLALATYKQLHGEVNDDMAWVLGILSEVAQLENDLPRSYELARESLEIRQSLLPQDDPNRTWSLYRVGLTLQNLNRFDEAEEVLLQASQSFERIFGENHPEVDNVHAALASNWRSQGRIQEAVDLLEKVVASHRVTYAPKHPVLAASLNKLASAKRDLGDFAGAEDVFRQALENFGDDNPWKPIAVSNLASIVRLRGRYIEAEQILVDLLETIESDLGPRHIFVARVKWELSAVRLCLGQPEAAEQRIRESAELFAELQPTNEITQLRAKTRLASALIDQGRLDEAENLLLEAQERLGHLESDQRDLLRVSFELGRTYIARGDLHRARPLIEASVPGISPLSAYDTQQAAEALKKLESLKKQPG